MSTRRHADDADLLGIESALLRIAADEPHRALSVLPRALVTGQALRPRRAVNEVDALKTDLRQFVAPELDEPDVTAVLVTAAGNEDHAPAVRVRRRRKPLEVRHPVRRRVKALLRLQRITACLVRHLADLVLLEMRNLPLRPQRHPLAVSPRLRRGEKRGGQQQAYNNKNRLFHFHLSTLSTNYLLNPFCVRKSQIRSSQV